ncbi:MAG: TraR/DksA family transcriptional regulator [Burkholderiales bacterium]
MAVLNKNQRNKIESLLEQRCNTLREEIADELEASGEQHYIDLAGAVADVGDASVADMLTDLGAAIVDRQINELRQIEAARARMGEDAFGLCIQCGIEIGYQRLCASPTAQRCFECQSVHEKTYSHENNPAL